MSESYTVGENAELNVDWQNRCSQSFTPLETHDLKYVDLTLKPVIAAHWPVCSIYEADVDGKPTGDLLIKAYDWDYPFWVWGFRKRCRFYFTGYVLEAGKQYCITLHTWDSIFPTIVHWYYNEGGGEYPRGCRSFSTDYGETWTAFPNDDMMFAEFGVPPTPPPLPNPPIANFTILDVQMENTTTGIKFLVTTNVPCFLKMYWTASEPLKHATEMLLRGAFWKNRIRFCFVNWHENNQVEESDSVYHTFIKEPWPHCETRWFIFRAKVDGVWSPSVSAIFKHHRFEIPAEWLICLDEPWSVPVFPPPLEKCFDEPWTDGGMFMRLAEHWLIPSFPPPLESGILETWPTATWPPEFNLLFKETWQ